MKEATKSPTFLVAAYAIHVGGGATLLNQFLSALPLKRCCTFLDARFLLKVQPNEVYFVKKSLWHRLRAEWQMKKKAKRVDISFFFGNLPPMFKNRSFTFLFLQNKYLVTNFPTSGFSFFVRFRVFLERMWLRLFIKNVDHVVVQTEHMKKALLEHLNSPAPVSVLPFCDRSQTQDVICKKVAKARRFIYVAGPEPHKNHTVLLNAWEKFSAQHSDCILTLTIEPPAVKSSNRVKYLGRIGHEEVLRQYKAHDCLIFPSLLESLGLPLIEAAHNGLRVLASDLDFANEIIKADLTFNPYDENAILTSLKKAYRGDFEHSENEHDLSVKLLNAREFVQCIESSYDKSS